MTINKICFIVFIIAFFCFNIQLSFADSLSDNLVIQLENLVFENRTYKAEIEKLNNRIDTLMLQNKKLKKELEVYKPQKLPKLTQADLTNKNLNIERIYRIRSGDCFDPNGDKSCLFRKIQVSEQKEGYLIYKTNRIVDESIIDNEFVSNEGTILKILTKEHAKMIKKWEKQNPELLILLSDY